MFDFSPIQMGLVLLIALLAFGPRRLPEMAKSLGNGVRELRGALNQQPETPRPAPATAGSEVPRVAEFASPTSD